MSRHFAVTVAAGILLQATSAFAQLDPTLFLKRSQPNVIVMIDNGADMQRGAPTDPSCFPGAANSANCTDTLANQTSTYYDPFIYTKTGAGWEATSLGINGTNV